MTTQLLEQSVPSLLLLTIASFYASCGQKEKKKSKGEASLKYLKEVLYCIFMLNMTL